MKKNILFLFLIFMILCVNFKVNALDYKISYDNELNTDFNIVSGSEVSVNCDGIFTKEALDLISDALGWFRILAPIALIILIAVDFGQAVLSQENDALKKAGSKILKRALATIALFFIPTLIRVLINLPGVRNSIQIPDDPLCGTMKSVITENDLIIK